MARVFIENGSPRESWDWFIQVFPHDNDLRHAQPWYMPRFPASGQIFMPGPLVGSQVHLCSASFVFCRSCIAPEPIDEVHNVTILRVHMKMLRFDRRSGNLAVTDLGRAASHFYISHESVFRFNAAMKPTLTDGAALNTVCLASEFDQVKVKRETLGRGGEGKARVL